MTELTEQEKLEKRRARRQQRILASASSRLNKITGTQSGKSIFSEKQRAFLTPFYPRYSRILNTVTVTFTFA
jgi:hypothetical protein